MKSDCNCVIKNPDIFTKNFLNNLPIPIVVITMDKKIYYVNAAFENITGYYKEEVLKNCHHIPGGQKMNLKNVMVYLINVLMVEKNM